MNKIVKTIKHQQSDQSQQNGQANRNQNGSSDQSQNASNDSNQQNNQSSNSNSGQRTHVVNGQNLYRIAIQYYGEGTPENVEKSEKQIIFKATIFIMVNVL